MYVLQSVADWLVQTWISLILTIIAGAIVLVLLYWWLFERDSPGGRR